MGKKGQCKSSRTIIQTGMNDYLGELMRCIRLNRSYNKLVIIDKKAVEGPQYTNNGNLIGLCRLYRQFFIYFLLTIQILYKLLLNPFIIGYERRHGA